MEDSAVERHASPDRGAGSFGPPDIPSSLPLMRQVRQAASVNTSALKSERTKFMFQCREIARQRHCAASPAAPGIHTGARSASAERIVRVSRDASARFTAACSACRYRTLPIGVSNPRSTGDRPARSTSPFAGIGDCDGVVISLLDRVRVRRPWRTPPRDPEWNWRLRLGSSPGRRQPKPKAAHPTCAVLQATPP